MQDAEDAKQRELFKRMCTGGCAPVKTIARKAKGATKATGALEQSVVCHILRDTCLPFKMLEQPFAETTGIQDLRKCQGNTVAQNENGEKYPQPSLQNWNEAGYKDFFKSLERCDSETICGVFNNNNGKNEWGERINVL